MVEVGWLTVAERRFGDSQLEGSATASTSLGLASERGRNLVAIRPGDRLPWRREPFDDTRRFLAPSAPGIGSSNHDRPW